MHTQWYDSSQVSYKVSGWGWCVDCVGSKYFLSLLSPQTLSQITCIFLIPITWDGISVPPEESTSSPPVSKSNAFGSANIFKAIPGVIWSHLMCGCCSFFSVVMFVC